MREVQSSRPIMTVYYTHSKVVIRTNRAAHADSAVMHAVNHMQHDHYGADVCEVFDSTTGELHAVLKRTVMEMRIIFKRDPRDF
jgi:hypothetical protein